jgi:predicted ArsR family transcriptional regulator
MAAVHAAPTPTLQALLVALADRPDSTAAELAEAGGIGRSTASKLLATLAAQGRVLCQPGGHQGGRRTPDRWALTAVRPPTAAAADSSAARTSHAGDVQHRPAAGRLGAGQLRDLVQAVLAQQSGQPLSPTAIANQLGRSAGAVANALQVLASQGRVVQAHTQPRRYVIADVCDPAATTD